MKTVELRIEPKRVITIEISKGGGGGPDTSKDTATAADILDGKTAHARGVQLTGTMPNRGADVFYVSTLDRCPIIEGYHDGEGYAVIDPAEAERIIPENIKRDIDVLGVIGTYEGEPVTAQEKTVTPSNSIQSVEPDAGYDYLSTVKVNPIPVSEEENEYGGTTVIIG